MEVLKKILRSARRKSIHKLTTYLEKPSKRQYKSEAVPEPEAFCFALQPCDIILMEGNLRYSEFIKYVTQSTWSHCGLYIGDAYEGYEKGPEQKSIIEVLLTDGTVVSPIKSYFGYNTRILRPVGLSKEDKNEIIQYCLKRIGTSYDILNVMDLLKHYMPFFKLILGGHKEKNFFGTKDPETVICSSLIAQAYQSVSYPILPDIESLQEAAEYRTQRSEADKLDTQSSILKKRHFSLFSPRDFDMSPFFTVIKPTLEGGFNHKYITWSDHDDNEFD